VAFIAGVDGCKGGWIAVRKDLRTNEISSAVYSFGRQLFSLSPDHEILALDIPIGLTDSGSRRCDILARKMLGRSRASCVFPAPIRPALIASDRKGADSISRAVDGKGVGAQAFGLYPRIRDIDAIMRGNDQARDITYEVHPELCFMALNQGQPIIQSKKSHEGMSARSALVILHFAEASVRLVRKAHSTGIVADDDIYDAFAGLWTAERIHSGIAEVVPDPPDTDSFGLPMAMWY